MLDIPNLFGLESHADKIYSQYLIKLTIRGRWGDVINTCHKIREFARVSGVVGSSLFTFNFEIDALCRTNDFKVAWDRLRERELNVYGRYLHLQDHDWVAGDADILSYKYCPLLYFRDEFVMGGKLLEIAIKLKKRTESSFDLLHLVAASESPPTSIFRVSLQNFYFELGLDLRTWNGWREFVDGFDSKLFALAQIDRYAMISDSKLLGLFFRRVLNEQERRSSSKTTRGESDLTESLDRVSKLQTIASLQEIRQAAYLQPKIDAQMAKYFSDLY